MAARGFDNGDDEKPLDPMVENVRRRMMRLMIISIGIMMIGLMAVLGAIVYKYNISSDRTAEMVVQERSSISPDRRYLTGKIMLDDGFTVESSSIAGDRILLNVRDEQGLLHLVVFDMLNAKIIADFPVLNKK